jgi:predicted RNA-binding protein with PIN domain
MANILIDGYNMMGIHHRDIKRAREEFLDLLNTYALHSGNKVVVIFDGYRGTARDIQGLQRGAIKVLYTPVGQKADDYIVDFVRSSNNEWIVVTSDNAITNEVWRTKSIPIDIDPFWDLLLSVRSGNLEDILDHIEELPLSAKKKRTLRKALSRL